MIAEMAGIKVPAETRVLIARLEHVGREHPLSGEKLSPILAFYSAKDLAAGIELCVRLLTFGGLGHTCSIHSQNEAAVREFGKAIPAFRIPVNTASVHGSIGYSTNLFPAMTLGCGAPGGNITSDNIGPQHLMNIKRIAWESRTVEHRSIPADQRLNATASAAHEEPAKAAAAAESSGVDRGLISRVVEHVMMERGIARGSAPAVGESGKPGAAPVTAAIIPSPAAEIVARVFSEKSSTANPGPPPAPISAPLPPIASAKPSIPELQASPFVSENDVRIAITRQQKIFIGPKTILTPSARDLGREHEIFVETTLPS
jgi:acetaldehyde dehydrogenase (acetylating)